MSQEKPQNQQDTTASERTPVCDSVLQRLERDSVHPRSRLFFQSRECLIWTLWFFTLLIGAVAVAVTLYVSMSVPYTLYEATHDNLLTAFISALPYVWILIFMLTVYLALVNLRHTKHGYRYQVYTLLVGSILLTVMVGTAMHTVGGGYVLDQTIGEMIAMYPSYERQRYVAWQKPEQGRLIGTLLPHEKSTSTEQDFSDYEFVFADMHQELWQIDTSELRQNDIELLHTVGEQEVRLLGTSTSPGVFKVCGVFPWEPGLALSREHLDQNRESFMEKVRAHYGAVEESNAIVGVASDETEAALEGEEPDNIARQGTVERICADIAAFRRAEGLLAP